MRWLHVVGRCGCRGFGRNIWRIVVFNSPIDFRVTGAVDQILGSETMQQIGTGSHDIGI